MRVNEVAAKLKTRTHECWSTHQHRDTPSGNIFDKARTPRRVAICLNAKLALEKPVHVRRCMVEARTEVQVNFFVTVIVGSVERLKGRSDRILCTHNHERERWTRRLCALGRCSCENITLERRKHKVWRWHHNVPIRVVTRLRSTRRPPLPIHRDDGRRPRGVVLCVELVFRKPFKTARAVIVHEKVKGVGLPG
jgi:hypothetical protein